MDKLKKMYKKYKNTKIYFLVSSLMIFILFSSVNYRVNIFLIITFIIVNSCYIFRTKISYSEQPVNYRLCILAGIIGILGYLKFYHNYIQVSFSPPKEKNFFLHFITDREFILSYIAIFMAIVGFQYLYVFCLWLKDVITPIKRQLLKEKKSLLIFFLIYFVAYFPLIRSFVYYYDDIARMTEGNKYPLTGSFSRYLSDFFITAIEGTKFLGDLSPLTHMIAIFIMSVTSILTIHTITDCTKISWKHIIAVLPVCISPYFAECMSYKYDSPCMALSVLLAVIPIVYYKDKTLKYIIIVFLGTVAVCTTYQASSGIFPLMVATIMLLRWKEGEAIKNVLLFGCKSVIGYCAGIIIFKFLLIEPANTNYVDTSMSLSNIIPNFKSYGNLIRTTWNTTWMVLLLVIIFSFILATVMSSKQNKLLSFIFSLFTVGFLFIFCFGVYPIFNHPLFCSRAMYGMTFAVAIVSIVLVSYKNLYLINTTPLVLSWLFFVFIIIYGNTISVQREYETFRKQELCADFKDIPSLNDHTKPLNLQIKGSVGYCKQVKNVMKEYPTLQCLLFIPMDNFPYNELLNYYDFYNVQLITENTDDFEQYQLPVLKDNIYHTISAKNNYVLIKLKELS